MPNQHKPRSMYKGLILYSEDNSHEKAMMIIDKNFTYKAILHDKDIDENGEIKKAHYHYVVKLDSCQTDKYLADILGIQENYVQKIISIKGALDYLIHKNSLDKYQYNESELFGDLDISQDSDSEFIRLVQLIKENKICSMKQLTQMAIDHQLLGTLRRNSYLFTQLLR